MEIASINNNTGLLLLPQFAQSTLNIQQKENKKNFVPVNKEGRPRIFKSKKELKRKIDEYLQDCKQHTEQVVTRDGIATIEKPLIPTIAGLAAFLDVDRQTIYNYEYKDEFFDIINSIKKKIIGEYEKATMNTEKNPAGKIFVMKNYGYTDKQELEIRSVNIVINDYRGRE